MVALEFNFERGHNHNAIYFFLRSSVVRRYSDKLFFGIYFQSVFRAKKKIIKIYRYLKPQAHLELFLEFKGGGVIADFRGLLS